MKTKQNSEGFTRAEMVVCLLTAALLVGAVLPGLSEARRNSRRTLCALNMFTMGRGVAIYSQDNMGMMPYQAWWSSGPWTSTTLYSASWFKTESTTDAGLITLLKPFGMGGLYDSGLVTDIAMFFCPGSEGTGTVGTDNRYYNPDYYTDPQTGNLWISPLDSAVRRVRSSYNFFKNNIRTMDRMAGLSYSYDLIDSWYYIGHRAVMNGTPLGMNALYGDTSVVYNSDPNLFEEYLWGADGSVPPNEDSSDAVEKFFEILRRLGNNAPPVGTGNAFICNESISEGARMGTWVYAP